MTISLKKRITVRGGDGTLYKEDSSIWNWGMGRNSGKTAAWTGLHYHETVYEMFACLQSRNALCHLYGNHNMELRKILPEAIILDNNARAEGMSA